MSSSERYGEWKLECKVYVGDLGYGAEKHELEDVFSRHGALRNVWIARNPPGFAFVEFEDYRDAEDACKALDGTTINGRKVRVEMSSGKSRWKYGPPTRSGWRGGFKDDWESEHKRSYSPRRSYSPKGRSRSRSRSSSRYRRSRSPYRKSNSPYRRSMSPYRKSISPYRRSRSPYRWSRSPFRKSNSPYRRSMSPYRRSRSPEKPYSRRRDW